MGDRGAMVLISAKRWPGQAPQIAILKTEERMTDTKASSTPAQAKAFRFAMPKPVRITGRSSSITNSFVNGIVPVVRPTEAQIDEALEILGMSEVVVCSYCGDPASEWDHLRPLVVGQQPTGYIHEIHNLVPACGKCNQSKGNKLWREWMFGNARHAPASRGVENLEARARRLEQYEQWGDATRVDFRAVVGEELWSKHWSNHAAILALMREAEKTVELIRAKVAAASGEH